MADEHTTDPIEEYHKLRLRIDEEVRKLENLHGPDITCHPGCATCCINLTVFPVEFFAILHDLDKTHFIQKDFQVNESGSCGFLDNKGLCLIYPFRPIICRTHGLPILYLDDSQDEPVWKVSFCELNFRGKTGIEFTVDRLLDIEAINTELNRINEQFISALPDKTYAGYERISLKDLCAALEDSQE